jgi:hypothetical protein
VLTALIVGSPVPKRRSRARWSTPTASELAEPQQHLVLWITVVLTTAIAAT